MFKSGAYKAAYNSLVAGLLANGINVEGIEGDSDEQLSAGIKAELDKGFVIKADHNALQKENQTALDNNEQASQDLKALKASMKSMETQMSAFEGQFGKLQASSENGLKEAAAAAAVEAGAKVLKDAAIEPVELDANGADDEAKLSTESDYYAAMRSAELAGDDDKFYALYTEFGDKFPGN